jgi:hypothetical protein
MIKLKTDQAKDYDQAKDCDQAKDYDQTKDCDQSKDCNWYLLLFLYENRLHRWHNG